MTRAGALRVSVREFAKEMQITDTEINLIAVTIAPLFNIELEPIEFQNSSYEFNNTSIP